MRNTFFSQNAILVLILFSTSASPEILDDSDLLNYKDHSCKRSCKEDSEPRVCKYTFVVERYSTMSKACYNCPKNISDCFRPHCIPADGVQKAVFSINRQVPGPTIEVCENDELELEVRNEMLSESTTIHWHGIEQRHTPFMDGVPYVSQCPILPGQNFIYQFRVTKPGTFFYHAHIGNQKADGLFGALIVRRASEHEYIANLSIHGEHTVIVNDWSYRSAEENNIRDLYYKSMSYAIDAVLVNGLGRRKFALNKYTPTAEFTVERGKNYRFRLIAAASDDCPIRMSVDQHEMKVISLESNDIEPVTVDAVIIWSGERIDFVLEANQKSGNYWIRFSGSGYCKDNGHQLAILRYDNFTSGMPEESDEKNLIDTADTPRIFNPYNDGTESTSPYSIVIPNLKSLEPSDLSLTQIIADQKIYITFDFYRIDNRDWQRRGLYGYQQALPGRRTVTPQLNHISMKMPNIPLMTQWNSLQKELFCNDTHPPGNLNCQREHCLCTHVIQLRMNSVVELVLIDEGGIFNANHPFHLHGHFFRVIASENLNGIVTVDRFKKFDEQGMIKRNLDRAPLKDTMKVPGGGYTILRFVADNPGYWLFHCHTEPHVNQGMALLFKVGEHEDFPPVPKNFLKCGSY